MTTSRHYSLIVPRLDRTGPCNVAVDLAHAAVAAGRTVQILYLSGEPGRDDLGPAVQARRFRLADLFGLHGVVHTHCLRPDLLGALLRLNRCCTVLTTLHNYFLIDLGFDYPRWKVWLAWSIWKRAIACMHHRVCISNAMRRYYRRLLPGQRFELAYNFRPALDGPQPEVEPALAGWLADQRRAGRTCLAYVGSLSPRKNLLPLVRAVAAARELALVICGQGPQRAALEQAVADAGASGRVLLAGQVPQPAGVVARADLLVLPSFAEGLPLVVLEAARLGVPSLLSNIAVHRELAALGLGATFDHRRFAGFGAAVQRLSLHATPDVRRQLVDLWHQRFSPVPGFAAYQRLLDGPDNRRSPPDTGLPP